MKQTPKPIGRPRFRIDGVRLRALRNETGLTLQALAQMVYDRAGKKQASPEVLKNTAQRWEASGAIPANMAKHLAEVLQTTVAILQGALPEAASSRIDEIENHLMHLISEGPSPRLLEALEHCKDADKPTRKLAIRISSRLEFAQLSQSQEDFEDIASITGYSIRELQQPTSFEGFWMLIGTGHLGPARSEILSGVASVLHAVRTELQTWLEDLHESDAHVTFTKEKHWYRVTISRPRRKHLTRTLRFVRCQPKESGLHWSAPTWLDRYWIEALPNNAYGYANFVTGLDAVPVPADCSTIRFAITKEPSLEEYKELGPDAQPEIVALTESHLSELPAESLEGFRREGTSHSVAVNWLEADLWDKLLPLMSEWPLQCWSFKIAQSRIDILLDVPYRLYATSKAPLLFGNRFSVMLVEILSDGGQKRAPWRQKSVVQVHERLTKSLLDARKAQTQSQPQSPAS
jgi:transcriptional regulator with XRE-family HTH domain